MELKESQRHILMLATLPQAAAPVVSCYLYREHGQPDSRQLLEGRVRSLCEVSCQSGNADLKKLRGIDDYLRQTALALRRMFSIFR